VTKMKRKNSITPKFAVCILISMLVGFTLLPLFAFASPQRDVRTLIPVGSIKVEVMQVGGSRRMVELGQKLQMAVSKDPNWWREFVSKAGPGKELPYDSRMGLTETEYSELKALSKQVTLNKTADATLEISTTDQKVFLIDGGSSLPELTGIEIDLTQNRVKTPFGVLENRSDIQPDEGQKVTGRWGGVQWKLEKQGSSDASGTIVKLAFGQRVDDGRGIMYYDVKSLQEGKSPVRISRILLYQLTQ